MVDNVSMIESESDTGIFHVQYPADDEADFDYRVTGMLNDDNHDSPGFRTYSVFLEFRGENCYVVIGSGDQPPQKSKFSDEEYRNMEELLDGRDFDTENVKQELSHNRGKGGNYSELSKDYLRKVFGNLKDQYVADTIREDYLTSK